MKFQITSAKSQINTKSQIPRLRQGFGGQANSKPFGILSFVFWSLFVIWILLFGISKVDAAVLQKPPTNLGLVGYWSFNEGTSTYAGDFSGNGNKGTLTNVALNPSTPSSGWNPGKLGKALSFDGSNDYVDVTRDVYNVASPVTVSAWVKTNSAIGSSALRRIASNRTTGNAGFSFGLNGAAGDTAKDRIGFTIQGVGDYASTNTVVPVGAWTHIAASYTGSSLTFYINGIQLNTTATGAMTTGSRMQLGVIAPANSAYFNGLIDEVRIYNRALSASEVAALYQSGAVKFQAPDNKGLVGYWSFNEGTSTYAGDFSKNENTGTLTNMALNPSTPSSGWNPGKFGKALSFDGGDDLVSASSTSLTSLSQMTVSAWIKPTTLGESNSGRIVQKSSNQNNTLLDGWALFFDAGPTLIFDVVSAGGQVINRSAANTIQTGIWQHVVGTWNGGFTGASSIKLYINGTEVVYGSASNGSGPLTGDLGIPLAIGANSNGQTRAYNGLIDEVRIYNRALSASEVAALYQSGAVKFQAPDNKGLVGYWSFNEGTSTYAGDFSKNENTGTLTNMALNPSTPSSGWNPGKLGKALSFDGSNDYVNINQNASLKPTTAVTVSSWIKPSATLANFHGVFHGPEASNTAGGYILTGVTGNKMRMYIDTLNGSGGWASATSITTFSNTWYHVVGSWDGANIKIYVNGILEATTAATTMGYGTSAINAEIGLYGGTYFPGLIDEVRVYNRALSAGEVQKLYESGR